LKKAFLLQVVIGSYPIASAARNRTVNATATPGFEELWTKGQMIDRGKFYASKDALFPPLLPVQQQRQQAANQTGAHYLHGDEQHAQGSSGSRGRPRRVNFGWAQHVSVPGSGPQTLPREVTFNAELKQLQWLPPVETEQLRTAVLTNRSRISLPTVPSSSADSGSGGGGPTNGTIGLKLQHGAGAQAEIRVVFRLPPPLMNHSDAAAAASTAGGSGERTRLSVLIMGSGTFCQNCYSRPGC
jgi:hypothetical protein